MKTFSYFNFLENYYEKLNLNKLQNLSKKQDMDYLSSLSINLKIHLSLNLKKPIIIIKNKNDYFEKYSITRANKRINRTKQNSH